MNKKLSVIIGAVVIVLILLACAVWFFMLSREDAPEGDGSIPTLPVSPGDTIPEPPESGGAPSPDVGVGNDQLPTQGVGFLDWLISLSADFTPTARDGQPAFVASVSPRDTTIPSDFTRYVREYSDTVMPYNTTVVSEYAFQSWGDEHTGGVALMKYSPETGWTVVDMGGGAPSLEWLLFLDVPITVAVELMERSGY